MRVKEYRFRIELIILDVLLISFVPLIHWTHGTLTLVKNSADYVVMFSTIIAIMFGIFVPYI